MLFVRDLPEEEKALSRLLFGYRRCLSLGFAKLFLKWFFDVCFAQLFLKLLDSTMEFELPATSYRENERSDGGRYLHV